MRNYITTSRIQAIIISFFIASLFILSTTAIEISQTRIQNNPCSLGKTTYVGTDNTYITNAKAATLAATKSVFRTPVSGTVPSKSLGQNQDLSAGDVIFSQMPILWGQSGWVGYTSDVSLAWYVQEDFYSMSSDKIGGVTFYGLALIWGPGWYPGDPTGQTFNIMFYEDSGGVPGTLVNEFDGVAPDTITPYDSCDGYGYDYQFTVERLPAVVTLDTGWIGIQAADTAPDGSVFLWVASATGNNNGEQNGINQGVNFAFYLTQGKTIYVDINNTLGPWDGTSQYPYQYIQQGIDHALPGDAVFVYHGIYPEQVVINKDEIQVIGERFNDTIIDGQGFGTCVRFTHYGCGLFNFTIQHSGKQGNDSGVAFNGYYCFLRQCIIKDNYYGIYATDSPNSIYRNNFFNNMHHAYTLQSNLWVENYWDGFPKVDANEDGIIDTPYNVSIMDQDLTPLLHPWGSIVNQKNKDYIFKTIQKAIDDGRTNDGDVITVAPDIYWEHILISKELAIQGQSKTTTIIDGHQNGTPVWINASNVTFQGFTIQDSGVNTNNYGVSIEADNTYLNNLLIHDNYNGILFRANGDKSFVYRCNISSNAWNGIGFAPGSTGNKVEECVLYKNGYAGVVIEASINNTFFHNAFLENLVVQASDNGQNIWDNGYPSGGNYWSDYTGRDANHDGIGDTPYPVKGGVDQDRYPLMHTFITNDTTPPYLKILSPISGIYLRNIRFFGHLVYHKAIVAYGALTFIVDASDNQSGIREVRFYLDQNPNPMRVVGHAPYRWTWRGVTLLLHKHLITVVAFDNAGNYNQTAITVYHYL